MEWKWPRLTIFVFDLWYDQYDRATAHHKVDLPVLLVDYGKKYSVVKLASREFRDEANNYVAEQHRLEGWDAKPPFFRDQTGPTPTYPNPRDVKITEADGTIRRLVKTPPPESDSAIRRD
ncbi:hypothetical protein NKR19_g2844 [Coniochaeta hoffmannii]|uniref:Uncharacterized protein n=1 Tax=Coniochaeta hoffmannii TaxID=91930 RepID=A0AA38VYR0_9PEZI|nr:hypothetical protein NKR19_g2844 [Coniochaeta hoffmannii]